MIIQQLYLRNKMSQKQNFKVQSLKEIKTELKEIKLLDSDFTKIKFQQVIRFVSIILTEKKTQSWQKRLQICFQIYQKDSNRSSVEVQLKQLCFIQLVSQEIKKKWEKQSEIDNALQFLSEKLQHLLDLSITGKSKQTNRNRITSTANDNRDRALSMTAIDWLKNKLSVSKDKKIKETKEEPKAKNIFQGNLVNKDVNQNKTINRQGRLNSLFSSQEKPIEREQSPFPNRKHLDKEISSLDILLKKKLYEPYIVFLLKFFMAKTIFYKSNKDTNETEKIWLIINIFLKMIEVAQNFNQFIRYSNAKYELMVVFLIRVFHADISNLYSTLRLLVKREKCIIDERLEIITRQQSNFQSGLFSLEQQLIKQLKLREFKEMIEQISVINEGLCFIYYNKYIYETLSSQGIRPPHTITTAGTDFDLIFQLVLKHEKIKKNQKQSNPSPKNAQKKYTEPPLKNINKGFGSALREKNKLKDEIGRTVANLVAKKKIEPKIENRNGQMNQTAQGRVSQFSRAINSRKK